jgi:hypothetical protein
MDFSIVSDTAGARVGELTCELRDILEHKINLRYTDINSNIGVAIRCLPTSYDRRSFDRYTQKDNYLTIDFCVSVEDYKKLYKIEQQFELGKVFLEWLNKGLSNKSFMKHNSNFDKEDFIDYVTILGKEEGWFADEVDYSQELEY